ncbi:RNA exonuclease [Apiospora phragmitis]|uniref:RNA exonuclease n=1 Tax=Apiospora phragmitis TaxID=2905665 RepID=A0ABR1TW95_9PEZI
MIFLRNAPGNAHRGHDCIEDTLAVRELALWCLMHPASLTAWGRAMRPEIAAKEPAEGEKQCKAGVFGLPILTQFLLLEFASFDFSPVL